MKVKCSKPLVELVLKFFKLKKIIYNSRKLFLKDKFHHDTPCLKVFNKSKTSFRTK